MHLLSREFRWLALMTHNGLGRQRIFHENERELEGSASAGVNLKGRIGVGRGGRRASPQKNTQAVEL